MDSNSLLQGVTDPEIRIIIKKFGKESTMMDSIVELSAFVEKSDSQVFVQNISQISQIIKLCFYHSGLEIRKKASILLQMIAKSFKPLFIQFSQMFLPVLVLYLNDIDNCVSDIAKELYLLLFPTPEKQSLFFKKMFDDIVIIVTELVNLVINRKLASGIDIGRLTYSIIQTTNLLYSCTKDDSFLYYIDECLPKVAWFSQWNNGFDSKIIPVVRISCYSYARFCIEEFSKCIFNESEIAKFFEFENNYKSQESLLELINAMLANGVISRDFLNNLAIKFIMNYSQLDSAIICSYLSQIGGEEVKVRIIESILSGYSIEAEILFVKIITGSQSDSILSFVIDLFNILASSKCSEYPFLQKCRLSVFDTIKDDQRINESLWKIEENRAIDYILSLNPAKSVTWLKHQKHISPQSLLKILKYVGTDLLKTEFPRLFSFPIGEFLKTDENEEEEEENNDASKKQSKKKKHGKKKNVGKTSYDTKNKKKSSNKPKWSKKTVGGGIQKEDIPDVEEDIAEDVPTITETIEDMNLVLNIDTTFIDLVLEYAEREDIIDLTISHSELIPEIISKWKRSIDILKCPQVESMTKSILSTDPTLGTQLSMIFGENISIESAFKENIIDYIREGYFLDNEMLQMIRNDDKLIGLLLHSSSLYQIANGHPIFINLISYMKDTINHTNGSQYAKISSKLVQNCGVDPKIFTIDIDMYPEFYVEFWGLCGYGLFDNILICQLLNSYIIRKMPWMKIFIYINEPDWHIIPSAFWEYLSKNPQLVQIAHESKLVFALACIIAASGAKVDLPHDPISLSIFQSSLPIDRSNDLDIEDIQIERNMVSFPTPNFNQDPNIHLLRRALHYLRNNISVLSTFTPMFPFIEKALHSNDRFEFFLTVQIISLIADSAKECESDTIFRLLVPQIVNYAPLPSIIENEVISAFRLCYCLQLDQFQSFLEWSMKYLNSSSSVQLINMIVPYISYFNLWDFISGLSNMVLEQPSIWTLVTSCLSMMPTQQRVKHNSRLMKFVPSLLSNMKHTDKEFEMISTSFPTKACSWFESNKPANHEELLSYSQRIITPHIYKVITKSLIKVKLEGVSYQFNQNALTILVSYKEFEGAGCLSMKIELLSGYPLKPLVVACDLGNNDLSQVCYEQVMSTIGVTQSIESGIKSWHSFVISKVKDSTPCVVCFSYTDANGSIPSSKCQTCGNCFHSQCLSNWFKYCQRPSCPYCASIWKKTTHK